MAGLTARLAAKLVVGCIGGAAGVADCAKAL